MGKFELQRDRFPVLKKSAYLDAPTTGAISSESQDLITHYIIDQTQNGMDMAKYIQQWNEVEILRNKLAAMFNARGPHEFAIGLNSSSLMNILANGIDFKPGDNVVTYDTNYTGISYMWLNKRSEQLEVRYAQSHEGVVTPEDLFALTDSHTRCIVVAHVDNHTGYRHELKKIGEFCRSKGIYFGVDATQSAGAMYIDVEDMYIDFLTAATYKWMLNIVGVAFMYVNENLLPNLRQSIMGWANPKDRIIDDPYSYVPSNRADRFEDGGLGFIGIRALQSVVDHYMELGGKDIENHILNLTDYIYEKLEKIPGIKIFGRYPRETRCGLICFYFPERWNITNESLQTAGIQAHVLGTDMVRIGIHFYNNHEDLDRLCGYLRMLSAENS